MSTPFFNFRKNNYFNKNVRDLQINDEIVDSRSTQEIIDMMRIIRGPLCVTVARKIDS